MSPFLANFSFCFCPLSICERVHSLAAKIFCVCENAALPFSKWKTEFSLPFFYLFCLFLHLLAERTSPPLRACTFYAEYDVAPFAPFAHILYFSWARQKNVSIRFAYRSTFFCRCQHLCRKVPHGRARWSASARPWYALFGSAFPAFDSSRKSALVWLSGSKVSYCRFPFFCRALSAVGIFFVSLFRFPVK